MNLGKTNKNPLNNITAYLAGVIIGDGNVSNASKSKKDKSKDYRITIEVTDLNFLINVEKLIKSIIKTKSTVTKRSKIKEKRKQLYYFQFRNKSFYYFLTKDLEIPAGKKSNIVFVPNKILKSNGLYPFFLAGVFDTDGGIRGKTPGFTSASKKLIDGLSFILNELKITHYLDSWVNKRYNQRYYGIKISVKDTDKFLNGLPSCNKEKLDKVLVHVDVPERSNGLEGLPI